MKRIISLCLIVIMCLCLSACANKTETVTITIPAKSAQSVQLYDTAFYATKNKIKVTCSGTKNAELILSPENDTLTGFITQTVTEGKSAKLNAKKGEKFKIGIVSQNDTDTDITVTLKLKNITFEE